MLKKLIYFASGLAALIASAGLTYWAYSMEIISWTGSSPYSTVTFAAILGFAAVITASLAVVPKKFFTGALVTLTSFWFGLSASILSPGFLGQPAAWDKPSESAAYSLSLEETEISPHLIEQVGNPLAGERSTLNYLAPLGDQEFVLVSSAGTEVFDWLEEGGNSVSGLRAIASFWDESLTLKSSVDLTAVQQEIQLVRGTYFDIETSTLYVSNLPLNSDCFGLQLWSMKLDRKEQSVSGAELLYTSQPCLDSMSGAERFGGRITKDSAGSLYLSIGDFGYGVSTVREEQQDGEFSSRPEILNAPHSIGAIVTIPASGEPEVVSRGHRNPQGLFWDANSGLLWESEHGPKGGDEVNIIQPGNDYGWPDVTYGGPYGGPPQPSDSWNLGRWYGMSHEGFTEPVFSWLPSTAASQILIYQGDAFSAWNNDLLVSSFKGDIRRLRLDGTRVVYDEVIPIGVRPRDIIQLSDGSLLVTTDNSTFLTIGPGSS